MWHDFNMKKIVWGEKQDVHTAAHYVYFEVNSLLHIVARLECRVTTIMANQNVTSVKNMI